MISDSLIAFLKAIDKIDPTKIPLKCKMKEPIPAIYGFSIASSHTIPPRKTYARGCLKNLFLSIRKIRIKIAHPMVIIEYDTPDRPAPYASFPLEKAAATIINASAALNHDIRKANPNFACPMDFSIMIENGKNINRFALRCAAAIAAEPPLVPCKKTPPKHCHILSAGYFHASRGYHSGFMRTVTVIKQQIAATITLKIGKCLLAV